MHERRETGWATALLCAVFLAWSGTWVPVAAADGTAAGLIDAVEGAGHSIRDGASIRKSCDDDPLCVARYLKDLIGEGARLVPDTNPAKPAKKSGWNERPPALTSVVVRGDGRRWITVARFDPKVIADAIRRGMADDPRAVILDLRPLGENVSLDAMRRTASVFIGRQGRAFRITYPNGRDIDWVVPEPPERLSPAGLAVIPGADADGVVVAFAALLRRHADTEVLGQGHAGTDFARVRLPVTPGWALLVPIGRISFPDVDISGGITPDRGIPD